jgi:hypothetical protein
MLHATFQVTGISDLMFGRPVLEGKKDNETHAMREERLWQKKVPVAGDGQCYINPFCVTNSLVSAAKWLGRKVDGKAGFAGRFQKGVTPGGKVLLFKQGVKEIPITIADVEPILLFVPSDGKRGSSKRVERIFPTVHPSWLARGDVYIWDGKITEEQFRDHLEAVGKFIGWGSMRVENGGINGRFKVDHVSFEELEG